MIDWDKPLECDHGSIEDVKADYQAATVCIGSVRYSVGMDGIAPTMLGHHFDVRNAISRKERLHLSWGITAQH